MLNDLSTINQRLAELEKEKSALLQRKEELLAQTNPTINSQSNLSLNEKVSLFRRLFRGRDEFFATRWQNTKGKSGYALACINPTYSKPKTKAEKEQRQFIALTDEVIYNHLSGKHVVGIYPLLANHTCYFLAVDFDKLGWQNAVKAMSNICHEHAIPHAIEISRSGNGAHLWIFFSEPVPASDARKLGFALLDRTMEAFPRLSFDSYDRLFPNQDTLPKGGFGNLIALPLQREPRNSGNTCFVDHTLIPYTDQWHYLNTIKKITAKDLQAQLTKLTPTSLNFDKPAPDILPWERLKNQTNISETFQNTPTSIKVILANQLYFELNQLPNSLITALKRLASFSNPVFFKTKAMRFSTHGISRFISCAHIEGNHLMLPRGCLDDVKKLFSENNVDITFIDKRQSGKPLEDLTSNITLKKNQQKAIKAMMQHDCGILHAPTAFGKTVTAIKLIEERKINTLILVHSRQLLDQWVARLSTFFADSSVDIGVIRGGKKKPTGLIDVATYQSFYNKKDNSIDTLLNEYLQGYGQVIVDECHHVSANRYETLVNDINAKYVLGLTATPERQDGHQKIMFMALGNVRHKAQVNQHTFTQKVIIHQLYELKNTPNSPLETDNKKPNITDLYRAMSESQERTKCIVQDVLASISKGKTPLILTQRRQNAQDIFDLLQNDVKAVLLTGAMSAKQRKIAQEKLSSAKVIVATGKYIGEGFDLARLDTLFLAMPIAWKGALAQYAGRIHRESADKSEVTIYDYVDAGIPMLERMFAKREKAYKTMGYEVRYG